MKRIKKLFSLMLVMIMMLAMGIPVMANEVEVTVTLPQDALLSGHTFTAYRIFAGTQTETEGDNKMSSVTWANEINSEQFLTALKGLENSPFTDCETAGDVAAVLSSDDVSGDVKLLEKVAQAAYDCKTGDGTLLTETTNRLPAGYYLIVDSTDPDVVGGDGVYNAALLQATKNVVIQMKTDKPSLDKTILEGEDNTPVDFNNGAIGQIVNYQLTSKVPDMSHYVNYKYVVNDVMGKGLTFDVESVKITVDGTELEKDVDFIVSTEKITDEYKTAHGVTGTDYDGGTAIKIVFTDFYNKYIEKIGADIVINYAAEINEDAVIGDKGNPNQASLKYPNKPNQVGEGDDFKDDGTDPSGNTPWDETRTFVTAIELLKTGEDGTTPLSGAQFKIEGEKLVTTLVTGIEYVVAENGGYWQLRDEAGNLSYTDVNPNDPDQKLTAEALGKYVDPNVQYKKVEVKRNLTTTETVNATAEVGADGILRIEGLAAGEYTITEVMAPNGYNMLAKPIKLVIEYTDPAQGQTNCTWSGTYDLQETETPNPQPLTFNGEIGALSFSVMNKQGSLLPSTGGIGTTIFYVVGGVLVAGAGILLVTKKRMSAR